MTELPPESEEAVHKAKNAAQALEVAREAQRAETIKQTKESMVEALQEVFGESEPTDPKQMKIMIQKIPLFCLQFTQVHAAIEEIKENQRWATRVSIGFFLTILTGIIALGVTFIFNAIIKA